MSPPEFTEDSQQSQGRVAWRHFWRNTFGRADAGGVAGSGWEWTAPAYVVDWGVGIVAVLLSKLYFEDMKPYERDIEPYLDDPNLRWPHVEDQRVPLELLDNLTITLPVLLTVFLVILSYLHSPSAASRSLLIPTIHHTLLSLLASHAISLLPLVLLKNYVGRLRPDFLSRCQPSISVPYICTGRLDLVLDGRRSFPSGHSQQAWCGLGWLALWVAGRNGAFTYGGDGQRGSGPLASRLLRGAVAAVWVAVATWISVSRLEDHMHHATDVLFGSLLGIISSLIAYHLYFPSPFDSRNLRNPGKPRLVYAHALPPVRGDEEERRWLLEEQREENGNAKSTRTEEDEPAERAEAGTSR